MQRLEISCAVRRIYTSLGAKGLIDILNNTHCVRHFMTLKLDLANKRQFWKRAFLYI